MPARTLRVAAYAVCVRGGSLLLAHYTARDEWALPGGGVDHGEHPYDYGYERPAFFVKQLGSVLAREVRADNAKGGWHGDEWPEWWPADLRYREFPASQGVPA